MNVEAVPVIILNWNGWDDTFQCLAALRTDRDVHDVWLVDNGSAVDRTAESDAYWPHLRVLRLGENRGYAGGYNQALQQAGECGHRFAYMLNNDTVVRPGFLRTAVGAMESDPGLAAVGSCIAFLDDPEYALFDGDYHPPGARRIAEFGLREVPEVNGAGMLVRLAAMQQTGFLDERFFCYGEETDWCHRVRASGWRVAVVSASLVLHRRKGSDTNHNALYYSLRNRFIPLKRFSLLRRTYWTATLLQECAEAAYSAQAAGDKARRGAIAAAARDALWSRFGKRSESSAPLTAWMLTHWGRRRALARGLRRSRWNADRSA